MYKQCIKQINLLRASKNAVTTYLEYSVKLVNTPTKHVQPYHIVVFIT